MPATIPALLVGIGLAAVVIGAMLRSRAAQPTLADIVDLPFGSRGIDPNRWMPPLPGRASLATTLAGADVHLPPEQFVVAVAVAALTGALLAVAMLQTWLAGVAVLALAPLGAAAHLSRKASARRRALEAQLPDALSMIASSLTAGHTLLRALQLLASEIDQPLAGELRRVVRETELGASPVDAIAGMAARVDVRDLRWVVQAIRVQQEVGGRLADLLHTLGDFVRARDEVRREVGALTAEGRMSMVVLGALPVVLLVALRVMNPEYLDPLLQGWGLVALLFSGAWAATGIALIRRMVRIEV